MPDYEIKIWNEDTFKVNSMPYVHQAYMRKRYAFVSDYVRLHALYTEGGIYLDTDVEVLKRFDDLLTSPAFVGFEAENYIGTGIMASERHGRWVKDIMARYEDREYLRTDGSEDTTTNVEMITAMLAAQGLLLKNGHHDMPGYLHIFPKEYFSPKAWNDRGLSITSNTYAIHHYDGSWMDRRQRWLMFIGQRFGAKTAHYIDYFCRPLPEVWKNLWASIKRRIKQNRG